MNKNECTPACDLTRLTTEERQRLEDDAHALFAAATALEPLPDGYAIGLGEASHALLTKLADFIALDRLCCGFLQHSLVCKPHDGGAWLQLTGGPGAKEAVWSDLARLLPAALTRPDLAARL